ncbi:MAG TPA: sigma-70 family RNA polymerase sigma factor [Rhizomicrobium sp.]|nr:sigma-70 family RNA polymerase sigma factor [Rhizomicrobium sp.]
MPLENDEKNLAARFEADRAHLTRVAYRMLGSLPEAEDAVQESWFRLSHDGADGIGNLTGWLTTVVARISLDMLRKRKSRREEPADPEAPEPAAPASASAPDRERELADSVGIALLVVLQALEPPERIAFVLHDMFDLPFDEIAPIVGRTPVATRQLASRARRRVQGAPKDEVRAERQVIDAFLLAAREGNFEALLEALDPQVTMRGDEAAIKLGGPRQLSGSHAVAKAFHGRAQAARFMLLDGAAGIAVAPNGRLLLVLGVTFRGGKIAGIEAIADPERLAGMAFTLPEG